MCRAVVLSVPGQVMDEALYYMLFATAVYGWKMYLWMNRTQGAPHAASKTRALLPPLFVQPHRIVLLLHTKQCSLCTS